MRHSPKRLHSVTSYRLLLTVSPGNLGERISFYTCPHRTETPCSLLRKTLPDGVDKNRVEWHYNVLLDQLLLILLNRANLPVKTERRAVSFNQYGKMKILQHQIHRFPAIVATHMLHNCCSPCSLYCDACAAFNVENCISRSQSRRRKHV